MQITTTKGNYSGSANDCQAWLDEYQPSHASVEIGGVSATIDDDLKASWVEAANQLLLDAGIGYEYSLTEDGDIRANESILVEDWDTMTEHDIRGIGRCQN